MTQNDRVLVTGGAGYLGREVVALALEARIEVVVVDDLSYGQQSAVPSAAKFMLCDVAGPDLARVIHDTRPTVIIHLAAMHFIPDCERRPTDALRRNVLGTSNVLEAAEQAGTSRVLNASTAAVYEPSRHPHTEDSSVRPMDVYGESKRVGEFLVQRSSIPTCNMRFFNLFGNSDTNPHFIPEMVEQAKHASVLKCGNLDSVRDYIHVRDAAAAVWGLARLTEMPTVANVCSERGLSGHQVLRYVADQIRPDLEIETDQARVRSSDRPYLVGDGSLLRRLLPDWSPRTFEAGLKSVGQT